MSSRPRTSGNRGHWSLKDGKQIKLYKCLSFNYFERVSRSQLEAGETEPGRLPKLSYEVKGSEIWGDQSSWSQDRQPDITEWHKEGTPESWRGSLLSIKYGRYKKKIQIKRRRKE